MSATARIPNILSIAGTDPSGGAGIQADLKSIAANGGYGMAVVTALVAQNTQGVRAVHVPPTAFLTQQLDAVSDDVRIDAVKIGMLANCEVIAAVSAWLDRVRPPRVVLDPVMVSTSGHRLLDAEAEDALRALISRAELLTPNMSELALLVDEPPATSWAGVLEQATRLAQRHTVRVLAKGGHLDGSAAPDALVEPARNTPTIVEFRATRVKTANTHGTGCSLASAIATRAALSGNWPQAISESKRWLTESIRQGEQLSVGSGRGPIHHFGEMWQRAAAR